MGNRRMISKTVTQTQRFLKLPLEAQALYFHLIQNSDDDGIVEAFPVVRMIGASDDSLGLLVIKQFIIPLNDEMVYFIVDFHEQNLVQKHHYKSSKYQELLPLEEKQKNPRITTSQTEKKIGCQEVNEMLTESYPNISKDKLSKDNISKGSGSSINNIIGREENTPPTTPFNQEFVNLYKSFEAETGKPLSPLQIEELKYMLDDFSPELIHEALKEAVSQGKANLAYIKAILSRWKSDNLLTINLVRNNKAVREDKKQSKQGIEPVNFEDWKPTAENPF